MSAERLRLEVRGPAEVIVELPAGGGAGGEQPLSAGGGTNDPPPATHLLRQPPADSVAGRLHVEVVVDGWRFEVVAEEAHRAALRERAARAAAAHHAGGHATVRAQIPGRVTRLWVSEGEHVEQGQRLLAIEAMKMENEIRAPRAGVVERLAVAEGALVELNDELLIVGEPAAAVAPPGAERP